MSREDLFGTLGSFQNATIDEVALSSRRLARDNARFNGGLLASNLLAAASREHPDFPELRTAARESFGYHTYYRTVTPSIADAFPKKPRRAYFDARTAIDPDVPHRKNFVAGRQHADALINRLAETEFHSLEDSLLYHLPARRTPTYIRIAVDRTGLNAPVRILVNFGGEKTHRMEVLPPSSGSDQVTLRHSGGKSGLHLVDSLHQGDEHGTLDYAISHRRGPAPLVDCAFHEFYVSQNAKVVRIETEGGSRMVPVGVQIRTGRTFQLTESEYRFNESALGPDAVAALFRTFLRSGAGADSKPGLEFINHWVPLRRYLYSKYRLFNGSVSQEMGDVRASIQLAGELEAMGDVFLAERMYRYLYLRNPDPAVRTEAFRRLVRMAGRQAEPEDARLNLYATAALLEPSAENLAELARLLIRNDETDYALQVALVLPLSPRTAELKVQTALLANWWATFQELPRIPLYDGFAAARFGNFRMAKGFWDQAGERGAKLNDYLGRSIEIRKEKNLKEWGNWEEAYPESRIWRNADSAVEEFPGACDVRAIETNRIFRMRISTPEEPFRVRFVSPRDIRFEFRPIHADGSDEALEGWVTVKVGSTTSRIPVILNRPSSGLEMTGFDGKSLGMKITGQLEISGWDQPVEIRPEGFAIAVRLQEKQPLFPVGFLPRLTAGTARAFLQSGESPGIPEPRVRAVGSDIFSSLNFVGHPSTRSAAAPSQLEPVVRVKTDPAIWKARQDLAELLRLYDQNPDKRDEIVALGSRIVARHPGDPMIARYGVRLKRHTAWEPVYTFEQSAGFREFETDGWEPESPVLATRIQLLPPLSRSEQYISGGDSSVSVFRLEEPAQIALQLQAEPIRILPPCDSPTRVEVIVDEKEPIVISLDRNENQWSYPIHAEAGRHSIKVRILNPAAQNYLRIGIAGIDEEVSELFNRAISRKYVVGTRSKPVSTWIEGPAWIRIDRRIGQFTDSEFRFVDDLTRLVLNPEEDGEAGYYRVHRLTNRDEKAYFPPRFRAAEVFGIPDVAFSMPLSGNVPASQAGDRAISEDQAGGTHSAGISYRKRKEQLEGPGSDDTRADQFLQADYTFRKYDESKNLYSVSQGLWRDPDSGADVLGVNQRFYWQPDYHPFSYGLFSYFFWQGEDWSGGISGSVSHTHELNPKLSNRTTLRLWGRYLSIDEAPAVRDAVDTDLFSPYKNDHRHGVSLQDELTWAPRRDVRIYAGAGVRSNEDLTLDAFDFWVGYKQLFGSLVLNVRYDGSHYVEDDDREHSAFRQRARVEVTRQIWKENRNRVEIGAGYSRLIEEEENTGYVFVRIHGNGGRMLKDFRPSEKPFGNLFQRRAVRRDDPQQKPRWNPFKKRKRQ
ncbi:MAG: hypothetical protein HKN23_03740 [Verrucomicrobiales bacterium]|nr:hypothetical protein [Verrucomicrobiales bacterium]